MTIALSWFTPGGATVVLTGAVTNVVDETLPAPPPQPAAMRATRAAPTAKDRLADRRRQDMAQMVTTVAPARACAAIPGVAVGVPSVGFGPCCGS